MDKLALGFDLNCEIFPSPPSSRVEDLSGFYVSAPRSSTDPRIIDAASGAGAPIGSLSAVAVTPSPIDSARITEKTPETTSSSISNFVRDSIAFSAKFDGLVWLLEGAFRTKNLDLIQAIIKKEPRDVVEATFHTILTKRSISQECKDAALVAAASEGNIFLMSLLLSHGPYTEELITSIILDAAQKNLFPVLNLLISTESQRAIALIELSKHGFKDSINALTKGEHLSIHDRIQVVKAFKSAGLINEAKLFIKSYLRLDVEGERLSDYRFATYVPELGGVINPFKEYINYYRAEMIIIAVDCGFTDIALELAGKGPIPIESYNFAILAAIGSGSFRLFQIISHMLDSESSSKQLIQTYTCFKGISEIVNSSSFTEEESCSMLNFLLTIGRLDSSRAVQLIDAARAAGKLRIAEILVRYNSFLLKSS